MQTDGSEDEALHIKKGVWYFFFVIPVSPWESLNESAQFGRKRYRVFYHTTSTVWIKILLAMKKIY